MLQCSVHIAPSVNTLTPWWTCTAKTERLSHTHLHQILNTLSQKSTLSPQNKLPRPSLKTITPNWIPPHHSELTQSSLRKLTMDWTYLLYSEHPQVTKNILAQCQALSSETEKLPKGLATLRWQWTLIFHNESNSHLKENLLVCFHWLW